MTKEEKAVIEAADKWAEEQGREELDELFQKVVAYRKTCRKTACDDSRTDGKTTKRLSQIEQELGRLKRQVYVVDTTVATHMEMMGLIHSHEKWIVQLKEKIETIVGTEEPTGAEGFEVEVHESEDQSQT